MVSLILFVWLGNVSLGQKKVIQAHSVLSEGARAIFQAFLVPALVLAAVPNAN